MSGEILRVLLGVKPGSYVDGKHLVRTLPLIVRESRRGVAISQDKQVKQFVTLQDLLGFEDMASFCRLSKHYEKHSSEIVADTLAELGDGDFSRENDIFTGLLLGYKPCCIRNYVKGERTPVVKTFYDRMFDAVLWRPTYMRCANC